MQERKSAAAVDAIDRRNQAESKQGARTDLAEKKQTAEPAKHFVDNINEVERPTGTSQAAALRRLRKDKPKLHAKVIAGELSANAAMIQAGFRVKTITVRAVRK